MQRNNRKCPPDAVLKAVLQYTNDAVVCKSAEGIITLWNRAAAELFGYTAPEVIGQRADVLVAPSERRLWHDGERRLRGGGAMCRVKAVRIKKDGARIRVILTATVIDKARSGSFEIMDLYRRIIENGAEQ